MANMYDHNEKIENDSGFNPKPGSKPIPAQISTSGKVVWILIIVFTLGLAWLFTNFSWSNYFNRQQNNINEKASLIDTQLAKRFDTMDSLVNAAKSYIIHEKSIMEDVTKLRAMANDVKAGDSTIDEKLALEKGISSLMSRFNAVFENYPNLKADGVVRDLMEESAYLNQEIAAARRLYNSEANDFNRNIMTWPKSFKAASMKLVTVELFRASVQERQKVSTKLNFE